MLSEEKITVFLNLQQIILDIKDERELLSQFLPKVLEKLLPLGFKYEFLSAVFVDISQKPGQTFFVDKSSNQVEVDNKVIHLENLLQKGTDWEMELMYGNPVVVSDMAQLVDPSYPNFSKIGSLLIFPIQTIHKLSGFLILASPLRVSKIDKDEIEFIEMITRLVDLAFRLQDTQTSLTKITQQVYEMNAKLHQLDKVKDDFISITSHELRTPMTAIRSYAWMALHKSDVPLSDKLNKYLIRVLLSTERLINLVNDMLNISRIESGKIEIDPEAVDLTALVKDIIDEVYYSKSTEKTFQFVVLEKPIPKVFADPDKLRQVLLNLVGNSLKFTPVGGKIIFDFFTDGKTVEVSVKDSGVGISKDDLSKLFHKFSRLDNSYTAISTSGGTGLGLYISKNLIELMHGKIWANSEGSGKGTTFTFSLPVATAEILSHAESFTVKPKGEVKGLEPAAI